jgi:Uma2 family endonuclease
MSAKTVLTYADYAALPDDGKRYELLDGELFVMPSPSGWHQVILANLVRALDLHVRPRHLGMILFAPLDVIFADTSVAEPDLIYLDSARLPLLGRRGIEGAATLLVEILSPSTTRHDREVKFALYARYGVPCYWIVDPEARALEAYRLEGPAYVLAMRVSGAAPCGPPPFDDLGLVVDDLWRGID